MSENRQSAKDPTYQSRYYHKHRSKKLAYQKVWVSFHRERVNEIQRNLHSKFKKAILEAYGNKCYCCGEMEKGFLTIDHINNDGKQHRARHGNQTNLMREIVKLGFPPDYRILCFNCNSGRAFNGGRCPHEGGGISLGDEQTR